jgi:hypothetical protein
VEQGEGLLDDVAELAQAVDVPRLAHPGEQEQCHAPGRPVRSLSLTAPFPSRRGELWGCEVESAPVLPHALARPAGAEDDGVMGEHDQDQTTSPNRRGRR